MTGKAYQLKEMKGIVDYLVEHKFYSEIRGRKMWMDFSNSSATTRTWQSLKETFLKRILPDIRNPYYKLTRDQVCSFQQGCDVQTKEQNNKLEIRSVSPGPKEKVGDKENNDQPSTSNENCNEVENAAGMDLKHAKITTRNRSSADTLILDGNPEELENHDNGQNTELIESAQAVLGDIDATSKSLKECLQFEYSEPLTPAVREVLEDFVTESEGSDDEPQMKNNENPQSNTPIHVNAEEEIDDLIIIEDSENIVEEAQSNKEKIGIEDGHEVELGPVFEEEVRSEQINDWLEVCVNENPEHIGSANQVIENGNENENQTTNVSVKIVNSTTEGEKSKEGKKSIENQDSLSTTADTLIPNNQEVLDVNATNSQNETDTHNIMPRETVARKRSTSQETRISKKKKLDNNLEAVEELKTNSKANVIEIDTANTIVTEAVFNTLRNTENYMDDCIPSTSKETKEKDDKDQNKNPCLQSVSLFEEQFNTTKYSDSEVETPIANNQEKAEQNSKNSTVDKNVTVAKIDATVEQNETVAKIDATVEQNETVAKIDATVEQNETVAKIDATVEQNETVARTDATDEQNETGAKIDATVEQNETVAKDSKVDKKEVIVLKSDSDEVRQVRLNRPTEPQRYKHLSKAFGFAPGPSEATQRRRSLRCRNRRSKSQRNSATMRSESSEWETGSGSDEYVSPPRGYRQRQGRRYLKPHSSRIISLEDGLVVAYGNKIYPLVKGGRPLKTLTYNNGSGSEEEENSYWRQKYVEEKKRTAELQKKLAKADSQPDAGPSLSPPITQTRDAPAPSELDMHKKMNITQIGDSGKIQITLSKSNEETINLEGHWPQVLPIVQQVMNMFYLTDANKPQGNQNPQDEVPKSTQNTQKDAIEVPKSIQIAQNETDRSGETTPIIPVIDLAAHSKVEELETAIFKEIEERDKADLTKDTANITKRSGRPKKTLSTISKQSEPAKRQRKSRAKTVEKATEDAPSRPLDAANTIKKGIEKSELRSERESIESRKDNKEGSEDTALIGKETDHGSVGVFEPPVTRKQAKKPRKSDNETDASARSVITRLSSKAKADDSDDELRYMLPPAPETKRKSAGKKAGSLENPHEISQDRSRNSVDSTQGYQDSDASPVNTATKRKRKVSLTVRKGKVVTRRKSTLSISELSLDSSNSSYFVPIKQTSDSAVYKTESYQVLMQNRKISVQKLEAINETSPLNCDNLRHMSGVSNSSESIVIEVGSSSNVSLPLSPELSVVENLSISREIIKNKHDPTINELQTNDSIVANIYNQYLMSDIDISVPLMEQECDLLNNSKGTDGDKNPEPLTIGTLNMNDLSDTLNKKLRDLLLESAKKMTVTDNEKLMEVDESNTENKKRAKKRCSTPQKRANAKKGKTRLNSVIEEHRESCSRGRRSCPPVVTFVPVDENANNSADVQLTVPKRKKDIIKVKIQRPKQKKKTDANMSKASVYTDSGVNETASISGLIEPSSDLELIHNHSETCLQANECIVSSDSIELVDNSKSIISLNSTEYLENELQKVMEDVDKLSGCSRAVQQIEVMSSEEVFRTPIETEFHSPINSSLLTEDLSEEVSPSPSKWYLLSEDDTNTTRPDQMTSNTRVTHFSANLKQLFPVTCAVPDLSTISEMSKENTKGLESDGETLGSDYQSLL